MGEQSTSAAGPASRAGWLDWLSVIGFALGLAYLFWMPLWQGGTLIGGDTFSYYFPQKTFLADALQQGEFPLWNPRVGAGYPIIAESQTGVLYPPTLLLYRFLDVHVAYSANQLWHYVVAFVGMWLVGGRFGLSRSAALLAALVYVYGWFAPRICLEWAIIGGAYLPWCVWLVEIWLVTGSRRALLWLAPLFGLFLLAGHFHLAFITTLALTAYVALRVCFRDRVIPSETTTPRPVNGSRWSKLAWFAGVLVTGYLLAAIQLGPTLELMTRSQRQEFTTESDPGYGHIPPWYLTQIFSSWIWYLPESDPDQALFHVGAFAYPCATNKVEAHLYFGMVPLLLVLVVLGTSVLQRRWLLPRPVTFWLLIGLLGVGLATGWPFMVLKHVPGFGYFRGAGRYGVLMAFAMALAAGTAFDVWFPVVRGALARRGFVWLLVMGLTTWDLYLVSRWVTYAVMLESPILSMRDSSEIQQSVSKSSRPVRLWSPGSNAATLLGESAYPVYLGLGPREYFDPRLASSFHDERDAEDPAAIAKQVEWLRRNGVTHIVSFQPLDEERWTVQPVYRGMDQLLSRVWARYDDPIYLYELQSPPGRVVDDRGQPVDLRVWHQSANQLLLTVDLNAESTVVVRELNYPGWEATLDGHPVPTLVADEMYRGVKVPAGAHQIVWTYRPRSLWWGAAVSVVCVLLWCIAYRRAGAQRT